MLTERILKQIAESNNVSVEQVKKDMREAIRAAMLCHPPEADAIWKELSPDGKEPSIEAFLKYCAENAARIVR